MRLRSSTLRWRTRARLAGKRDPDPPPLQPPQVTEPRLADERDPDQPLNATQLLHPWPAYATKIFHTPPARATHIPRQTQPRSTSATASAGDRASPANATQLRLPLCTRPIAKDAAGVVGNIFAFGLFVSPM